jgi:hypothetical protein
MEFEIDDNSLFTRNNGVNTTYNRNIYDWYREGSNITIFLRTNNKIVDKFTYEAH